MMLTTHARIFVATTSIDFRGSFDRLSGHVRERLGENPRSGAFFIFFNRRCDRTKIFFFDQTGECVLYKRLDGGTFRGAIDLDTNCVRVEIDADQLRGLLAGVPNSRNRRRMH